MWLPTLLTASAFASVHVLSPLLERIGRQPRSRWLSAAGGVGVAYVFVHILPELAEHQMHFAGQPHGSWMGTHVYLIAMVGLGVFYGLDRLAARGRARGADRVERGQADDPSAGMFWLHVGVFILYNGLLGYLLLHREEPGGWSLAIYALAVGLHFVTNDVALASEFPRHYRRVGRWLLAAAALGGWLLGLVGPEPSPLVVGSLFSLLAGGMILNTLKEELPAERESRFWAFAAAAGGFTALLLVG